MIEVQVFDGDGVEPESIYNTDHIELYDDLGLLDGITDVHEVNFGKDGKLLVVKMNETCSAYKLLRKAYNRTWSAKNPDYMFTLKTSKQKTYLQCHITRIAHPNTTNPNGSTDFGIRYEKAILNGSN